MRKMDSGGLEIGIRSGKSEYMMSNISHLDNPLSVDGFAEEFQIKETKNLDKKAKTRELE